MVSGQSDIRSSKIFLVAFYSILFAKILENCVATSSPCRKAQVTLYASERCKMSSGVL